MLCQTAAERRALARAVYEQGEPRGLEGFRAADNHLHSMVACSRAEAGRFARILETSLTWRLTGDARFEPARFTSVRDQFHRYRTFQYMLRQERHHGTVIDPFHDAGCLPDLVGARVLRCPGGTSLGAVLCQSVARNLPRVGRRELLVELGIDDVERDPHIVDLGAAAAAAFGLDRLEGRGRIRSEARCAAVHAAAGSPLPRSPGTSGSRPAR